MSDKISLEISGESTCLNDTNIRELIAENEALKAEIEKLKSDLDKIKTVYIEITNSRLHSDDMGNIGYTATLEDMHKLDYIFEEQLD